MKERTAAAISYNPEDPAPRVIASGKNDEALRMLAIARQAGIEIVEDPALAALLAAGTRVGDYIPLWCWEAVAKILAFVQAKERG
ncbi:MAG: EscU/YscU/HrcU family type III secretion system export apparatus switch protein [Spirochaetaceae bacterium]|jgi:flagellar biosynthesis protein|nr:EscU/YscU/HrcU family type III secretion system export apparatus switch protein [Spirochaetaceae bacterium]